MRTELAPGARAGRAAAVLAAALTAAALAPGVGAAEEGAGSAEGAGKPGADWESWRADNEVTDIASPHVLSELEGLKRAVFRDVVRHGEGGTEIHEQVFDHFEQIAPGRLGAAEYDGFVRDTVNFLDYVGEPTQTARRALGIWVVLFLLVFSWLAWLVKREYWKDVH